MAKILVTGGAGFIGSHLCDYLLAKGHDVLCVDNLFSGNKDNIRHLLNHSYFEFIRHDIVQPFYAEVDQIYHLACPASPIHYQYNPIKTIKTNVMGTINMLGLAKRVRAKILLASTSEVYGDPKLHPQPETYWGNVNPIGVRSCYDEGKRVAEALMMDYHRQNHVDIRIARIFNTYGPRMAIDDGRVISNFIIQALKKEDITIYGNGNQTRSFCYISDLIEGIVRIAEMNDFIGPINLGNPSELTILELANKILSIVKSQSKIIFKPLPSDDPERRCPDITIAKKVINWEPKITLDHGLKRTIEYFEEKLGSGVNRNTI
jgi:UDP-glucuronate decarboxylase